MKLLIAHADRHGSTQEIAETLGAQIYTELLNHGVACGVDVLDVDDVETLQEYDAVVLGSALHFGRRCAPMRRFVAANSEALTTLPLWAFDSGLPGAETTPVVPEVFRSLAAISYRRFGGDVVRSHLAWPERALVTLRGGENADLPTLDAVYIWGHTIASSIGATRNVSARSDLY